MYEPDARLRGLESAAGCKTFAEHRSVEKQVANSESVPAKSMKKRHRSCVMRAMYLAQDDLSIAESVKTLPRLMRVLTQGY